MGGVYEIRGDALNNRLALKVLRPQLASDPSLIERFRREARIQARLDHPGIARVFELVETDDRVGIVMEFIDAPTLRKRLTEGRPSPDAARAIATEIAEALMAAHEVGVVHRDIKPENVFVWTDRLGRHRCKLIDFGIAKRTNDAGTVVTSLTRSGAFIGTYAYSSPEQITHEQPVDHRSDLYSLGVVLWEMLAGVQPYRSLTSGYSVQAAVVNDGLPRLPADVPEDLHRVVVELTRRDPAERPQSAEEVLRLLRGPGSSLSAETQFPGHVGSVSQASRSSAPSRSRESGAGGVAATVVMSTDPAQAPPRATTPPRPAPAPAPRQKAASGRPQVSGQLVFGPSLQPASLLDRVFTRSMDELVPQVVQLTCIGIVVYPFLVLLQGRIEGQSNGRAMRSLRVYSVLDGQPAASGRMLGRNLYDLLFLQIPLLGITSPLSWLAFPLPILAMMWLVVAVPLELAPLILGQQNRRVADHLFGTQVCREGRR